MVGRKLNPSVSTLKRLAKALIDLKEKIGYCSECGNLAEKELCLICSDPRRDRKTICVVEEPNDLLAIEKTGSYQGVYHVLMGSLSPLEGVGPDDIQIKSLLNRIQRESRNEIILATNPNVEGEATSMYLSRLLKPMGLKVTRIAHGIPVGGDLEYADEVTMARALEGRREV